jgi:hypothetical protein
MPALREAHRSLQAATRRVNFARLDSLLASPPMNCTDVAAVLVLALGPCLGGCVAGVGVGSSLVSVPKDAAATCTRTCEGVGLSFSALVVMGNVACVCSPKGSAPDVTKPAAGATAAFVAAAEEEENRKK